MECSGLLHAVGEELVGLRVEEQQQDDDVERHGQEGAEHPGLSTPTRHDEDDAAEYPDDDEDRQQDARHVASAADRDGKDRVDDRDDQDRDTRNDRDRPRSGVPGFGQVEFLQAVGHDRGIAGGDGRAGDDRRDGSHEGEREADPQQDGDDGDLARAYANFRHGSKVAASIARSEHPGLGVAHNSGYLGNDEEPRDDVGDEQPDACRPEHVIGLNERDCARQDCDPGASPEDDSARVAAAEHQRGEEGAHKRG